jgi:hypothetical protein
MWGELRRTATLQRGEAASALRNPQLNLSGCAVFGGDMSATDPKGSEMKLVIAPAAFALLLAAGSALAPPAQAKGCIKGAVVGGVAGHYAHHHAVLGALGGCAVGHHLATKHAREEREQQSQHDYSGDSGSASSSYNGR